MKRSNNTLKGTIIDKKTKKARVQLRIEVWVQKIRIQKLIGTSVTDQNGQFEITLDSKQLSKLRRAKKAQLFYKIYQDEQQIYTTSAKDISADDFVTTTQIEIDLPTSENIELPELDSLDTTDNQWQVKGRVTNPHGEPVNALVKAFDVNIKENQSLGQGITDNGVYVISYQLELGDESLTNCKLPDIKVEAYRNDVLIASSEIVYNAGQLTTIDLVIGNQAYKGLSEFDTLEQLLQPCLEGQSPETLTEAHIEYLANKTGADQQRITLYSLSYRQSVLVQTAPPLFYGCYRKGLPYSLDKLTALKSQVIRTRIQMAVDDNIIDQKWVDEVDDFMSSLTTSGIKSALSIDADTTKTSLGKVFTQINIPESDQIEVLTLYLKNQENIQIFWEELRKNQTLGQYENQLRLVLKISALTQHYEPATIALMEHPIFDQSTDISQLTGLSTSDWSAITKSIGSAPENIPGKDEEQLVNYGLLMEKSIMSAFPTSHVAVNISKSDQYQNTELPKFFEVATDFSFVGTNISEYVNGLNGSITDKETVIKDLSKLQRLFYLAPAHNRYAVIEALDSEGLHSALQIKRYGKKAFINTFGRKIGQTLAAKLYSKASYVNAATMNLALQYNDLSGGVLPHVLQGNNVESSKPEALGLPDLNTLFGGQSFCSCKHCRSVYSAAAYFVDLLSYLGEHYAIDQDLSTEDDLVYKETTGLDLLFERRAELGEIVLNCENTNTMIPYLDIVNEVLENAIAPLLSGAANQTTSTSEELKANPEHINLVAYEKLSDEIFPFSQPFNLFNEEGKVYLEHLGITRNKMMDTFQFLGGINEPNDQDKYAVQLNLTSNGKEIIVGETTLDTVSYTTKDFWGVDATQWRVALINVRTFIDKIEISYEQLLEFLQLNFVNATGIVKVKFAPEAPCDIDQAILSYWDDSTESFSSDPINEKFFIRAHCFFRLLNKVPWTIFELGRIMDALGIENITESFIEQIAILLQVQEKFDIEPLELISWWTILNTQSDENNTSDRSFYARYFLNKTVFDPQEINEETFVFTLNSEKTELLNSNYLISDYMNEIAAALHISSQDLGLLTETLRTAIDEVDDALNLKNLSQLFRLVSLINAVDISVEEYLIAVDFITGTPFDSSQPTELLSFVQQIEQVQRSHFSFSELRYLLLDQYNSTEGIAPAEDHISSLFISLQEGMSKIKSEHEVVLDESGIPIDPIGELCKQKLSLLIETEGLDAVVTLVEATDELSAEDEANAATYLYFLDVDQLIVDFATETYSSIDTRYAYILERLLEYLVIIQSQSFIIQSIAEDLSIDQDTSELLLTQLLYSANPAMDPNTPIFTITDFTDPAFAYDELVEDEVFDLSEFSIQHNSYLMLYKSAMFITKFDLTVDDISWTFLNGSGIGWIDLNEITGAAPDVFLAWRKTEKFFYMRQQFAQGDTTFFDLMEYAADPIVLETVETGYEEEVDAFIAESTIWTDMDADFLIFLNLVSEITGWEKDSLFYFASTEAYSFSFENFKDEQAFYQLMQCFEVLNILGASAQDAWSWMAVDLTVENSANIKQIAKSNYSLTQWLDVAAPLRDIVREKQRDALTAYLIQNGGFKDENALYEYYLLDVETSACTMSSRIVLANSSVQLFVQRHLMNLETERVDLDIDRWEWMKNYRVWEANRKVFLYPENWIEPELRLSKSEFFTDLQNALLQNDVTANLVENSIKDYLEKLDTVSNIEVCGSYHEYEEKDGITTIDVLHVFGRTSSVPKEFFYRTFIDNMHWTPWTKVNLDIKGDLVPLVIDGKLHLFWMEMVETQRDDDPFIDYVWQIKLAYSEYKNGKWLAKKVTEEFIESPGFSYSGVPFNFFFVTEQLDSYVKFRFKWIIISDDEYEGSFQFYYATKKIKISPMIPVENNELLTIKPTDSIVDNMAYLEGGYHNSLELPSAKVDANGNYEGNENYIKVLDATPSPFRIPIPHQYEVFVSQTNFFYNDDDRNFFVKPYSSFDYDYTNGTGNSSEELGTHLDFYLNESDIEVGIFEETIYDIQGIEEIILDNGPKDQIDPLPTFLTKIAQSTITKNTTIDEPKIKLETNTKTADTNLESIMVNQQVEQFEYLGIKKYRFHNFYHPYINDFIKTVNLDGISGLLTREMQQQLLEYFDTTYDPTENVHTTYPIREVDFSNTGAMSFYNWELFFHIPMLIAARLSENQQFEDAQRWYHFIFNPLDRSSEVSPNKFWQFIPFFELYSDGESASEDSIYNLLYALSYMGTDSELLDKKEEVEQQIKVWLDNSFDPHAIAALRPVAYMKSVVMKYIDNLIDWGDQLFQQDTIESINEATQIYILAAQILGDRPELIPVEETEARTYNQLIDEAGELDAFSNALVSLENTYTSENSFKDSSVTTELLPTTLYFCIPNNPNLLAYWDTVEDRLFKIRHCMNIEGIVRQLPLFQSPIDPALLVKARAAGVSIGSVLNDMYAPLSHYRYRVIFQKSLELCADVKTLGTALLSALEKKDAEEITLLRAGQELKLLQITTDIKKLQLDEAQETLSGLKTMRKITESRHEYYVKIEKTSEKEALQLNKLEMAQILQSIGQGYDLAAQYSRLIPETEASVPPSATFGGANLGDALNFYGSYYRFLSSIESYQANKASIEASHNRRWDDWKLQEKLASRELDHIDKQITASEIRVALMEKEVDNHMIHIDHSQEVNDFMTSKFTNKELYEWMSGQLSTIYFQSYQIAYDLAKKAQKCFQYELASDQTFIEFGYWDSLKKGLLAGDKLHYDLRRMETVYLDQNKRMFELTKSISLSMLDPMALIQLREDGSCYINLSEVLFDLDHPGHYLRRIKSVQLTIPCVTGPYTSINCKLTLLDNKWRKDTSGEYPENIEEDYDTRFVYQTGGTQSIATSSGQNDSGMFQLNFNDERYLPFEGAGAISNWLLEIPSSIRSFDYNSISDVIISLNYTAKDGGNLLRDKANETLGQALQEMSLGSGEDAIGLTRMFSLKHELSNEWYRFLNPPVDQEGQNMVLDLGIEKFPFMFRDEGINITSLEMIMIIADSSIEEGISHTIKLGVIMPSGQVLTSMSGEVETEGILLSTNNNLGGQLYEASSMLFSENPGEWIVSVDEEEIPDILILDENDHKRLDPEIVKDLILVFRYSIT
ncbi:Tc toxin subunit A-related protein [Aquimarina pacifica]|uniref:Tc toxin subunit A-related protein n=1 Tax=Aquimarina pacifica TaxID=1296415 RepID=UPI00046FFAE3|nr:neuraminidase-like domain-containing protein [Aquimarina pacifica]